MSIYIQFIRRRTYVAYTRLHSCIFGYAKIGVNRCPLEVRMRRNVYWRIRSSKFEILTDFGWSQTMLLDLYIRLSWRTGHFKCSFHGHSSNLRTLDFFFVAFSLNSWCIEDALGAFVYFQHPRLFEQLKNNFKLENNSKIQERRKLNLIIYSTRC